MTTTAKEIPFLTLGMPDEGAPCESCTFRTGTEKVYKITSDEPLWDGKFAVLCQGCVGRADDVEVAK